MHIHVDDVEEMSYRLEDTNLQCIGHHDKINCFKLPGRKICFIFSQKDTRRQTTHNFITQLIIEKKLGERAYDSQMRLLSFRYLKYTFCHFN